MHEHTGNCCGQHEHMDSEHTHHVAEQMGRLCCAGQCQHPEHQHMQTMLEQEYMYNNQRLDESIQIQPAAEKKKAKKKKRSSPWLGQLLARAS